MSTDTQYKVRIWTHEHGTRKLRSRVILKAESVEAAIAEVKRTQPKRDTPRFYTCREVG